MPSIQLARLALGFCFAAPATAEIPFVRRESGVHFRCVWVWGGEWFVATATPNEEDDADADVDASFSTCAEARRCSDRLLRWSAGLLEKIRGTPRGSRGGEVYADLFCYRGCVCRWEFGEI
jgi:hypothetical protein